VGQSNKIWPQVAALEARVEELEAANATLTTQLATCEGALNDCLHPPLPVDCVKAWGVPVRVSETPCVDGKKTVTWTQTEVMVDPPQNGGTCNLLTETYTTEEDCVVIPPVTPTPVFRSLGAHVLCFYEWNQSSGYERFQRLIILGEQAEIGFHYLNFAGGGATMLLPVGQYKLLMDGAEVGTADIGAGKTYGKFQVSFTEAQSGWHIFDIVPPTPMSVAFFPMRVLVGTFVPDEKIPVWSGSYDITHGSPFCYAWMPPQFSPTPKPLVPRECPHFNTPISGDQLYLTNVAPMRVVNINRPNKHSSGVMSTANFQAYHYFYLQGKTPHLSFIDGPRGVASTAMLTHIQVDRHGGAYACSPWAVERIDQTGARRTRAGFRHKMPPSYYGTPDLELIGDWSQVPVNLRQFWELWGLAFWKKTLALDPNAPPQGGGQPHLNGPQLFAASSGNHTIFRLTFPKDDFEADPVVTVFATGLARPFDVVEHNDIVYVSEENANKISKWDAATGASLGTLLFTNKPQGMYLYKDWLYWGSHIAPCKIERQNLVTGVREVVGTARIDDNSQFFKMAVSDGTFGPEFTVFYVTWSNARFGMPETILPTGGSWNYYNYDSPIGGKGPYWNASSYGCAVGVGNGRMYFSSAAEGLKMFSKALPGEVAVDIAKYQRGGIKYRDKGYRFIHGDFTFGYYGFPLPFGEDPDMDYYMTNAVL